MKNKEWIFSGIGVFFLTILIAYISKGKEKPKKISKETAEYNHSSFDNSPVNNIKGDKISFNQTIVNNIKEKLQEKEKSIPIIATDELAKAKQDFISEKARIRTIIYTALATAKTQKLEKKIEVRHILDAVEDFIGVSHTNTVSELLEMEEEGLIQFDFKKGESLLSPYTLISLTGKFYSTIMNL